MNRVLVIKFGALGDMVLAFAAMKRIREAHPEAQIDLLTTEPFYALTSRCPYVDAVQRDGRPEGWRDTLAMIRRLRRTRYDRVYDLQTSSRSSALFYALQPNAPEWSGIAWGCSHPHRNPDRDRMHTLERQADQLKDAGIWPDAPTAPGTAPPPDLSWLLAANADKPWIRPAYYGLTEPYALLIPGGSAHRPEKRWPVERYAELARMLKQDGLRPVVVGGPQERELAAYVTALEPSAMDLTGRTDFLQLAALSTDAALAVGNDTGPTHMAAAAGAPTLALFSSASDPALCAPRGRRAAALRRDDLSDLSVAEAAEAAWSLIGSGC